MKITQLPNYSMYTNHRNTGNSHKPSFGARHMTGPIIGLCVASVAATGDGIYLYKGITGDQFLPQENVDNIRKFKEQSANEKIMLTDKNVKPYKIIEYLNNADNLQLEGYTENKDVDNIFINKLRAEVRNIYRSMSTEEKIEQAKTIESALNEIKSVLAEESQLISNLSTVLCETEGNISGSSVIGTGGVKGNIKRKDTIENEKLKARALRVLALLEGTEKMSSHIETIMNSKSSNNKTFLGAVSELFKINDELHLNDSTTQDISRVLKEAQLRVAENLTDEDLKLYEQKFSETIDALSMSIREFGSIVLLGGIEMLSILLGIACAMDIKGELKKSDKI